MSGLSGNVSNGGTFKIEDELFNALHEKAGSLTVTGKFLAHGNEEGSLTVKSRVCNESPSYSTTAA